VAAELPEPAHEGLGLEPGQHFGAGVVAGERVRVTETELGPHLRIGGAEEEVVDPLGVEDGSDPLQQPEDGGPVVGRHGVEHELAAVDGAPHLALRQERDVHLAQNAHVATPPRPGPGPSKG
jgi:hypothetical protein